MDQTNLCRFSLLASFSTVLTLNGTPHGLTLCAAFGTGSLGSFPAREEKAGRDPSAQVLQSTFGGKSELAS